LHPGVRLYEAADGWVFVAATDDAAQQRLAASLGVEDPAEWAARFTTRPVDEWVHDLGAAGVTCVRVHDGLYADYVLSSPWAEPLGFTEQSADGGMGPYVRYGRVVETAHDLGRPGPADRAGAQTVAILGELGYPDDEIDNLLARGILGKPA
jgi:crotonobetainyl-CoA:carnitine CoA-transferase CaiB-like acyl-CoA transferase